MTLFCVARTSIGSVGGTQRHAYRHGQRRYLLVEYSAVPPEAIVPFLVPFRINLTAELQVKGHSEVWIDMLNDLLAEADFFVDMRAPHGRLGHVWSRVFGAYGGDVGIEAPANFVEQ